MYINLIRDIIYYNVKNNLIRDIIYYNIKNNLIRDKIYYNIKNNKESSILAWTIEAKGRLTVAVFLSSQSL